VLIFIIFLCILEQNWHATFAKLARYIFIFRFFIQKMQKFCLFLGRTVELWKVLLLLFFFILIECASYTDPIAAARLLRTLLLSTQRDRQDSQTTRAASYSLSYSSKHNYFLRTINLIITHAVNFHCKFIDYFYRKKKLRIIYPFRIETIKNESIVLQWYLYAQ